MVIMQLKEGCLNDLVLVEPTNNNPYVILAVKPENKDRDDVKALVEVLTSDFIKILSMTNIMAELFLSKSNYNKTSLY